MPEFSLRDVLATIHELAEGPLKIQMEQVLMAYDGKSAPITEDPPIANAVTPTEESLRKWLYVFQPTGTRMLSPAECATIAAKARELFAATTSKDTAIVHAIAKAMGGVKDSGTTLAESVADLVDKYLMATAEIQEIVEALDPEEDGFPVEKIKRLRKGNAILQTERDRLLNSNAALKDALQTARKERDQAKEAKNLAADVGFERGVKAAAEVAKTAADPISAYRRHDGSVTMLGTEEENAATQRRLCVEAIHGLLRGAAR